MIFANKKINNKLLFKRYCSGQAAIEYTLVAALAVIILIVPDASGNVVIVQLANAMKAYYNAFAFAMSFSNAITPL